MVLVCSWGTQHVLLVAQQSRVSVPRQRHNGGGFATGGSEGAGSSCRRVAAAVVHFERHSNYIGARRRISCSAGHSKAIAFLLAWGETKNPIEMRPWLLPGDEAIVQFR